MRQATVLAWLALLAACFVAGKPSLAADHVDPATANSSTDDCASWPFLRGPNYDGCSSCTKLADAWPTEGPPVLWTVELGTGYSAFVATGDRVYTQTQSLYGQYVVCLDGDTGVRIWEYRYDWPYEGGGMYPGPRATPTVADGHVFFAGPHGEVGCLRATDGTLVWSRNLKEQYHGRGTDFGSSCSPLVIDGKVIVPVGGPGASVVAVDARDGATVWKAGDQPASYCSAIPISIDGRTLIVAYLQNALALFDMKSGKLLWQELFSRGYDEHSAFPLYHEPDLVITSAFKGGSSAYRLSLQSDEGHAEPDRVAATLLWQSSKLSNDVVSSVLVDGYAYGFDLRDVQTKPHRPSRGKFSCVDVATGEVQWATEATGHASVVAADGKLILLNDEGAVILVQANPAEYQELARTQVFVGEICWTAPCLSRGRLYVRSPARAACLFLGDPAGLDRGQRDVALTPGGIPQTRTFRLAWLLGGEREYPFDPPNVRELRLWYVWCLAGSFAVAWLVSLATWLAVRFWPGSVDVVMRGDRAATAARTAFWVTALLAAIAGMPLWNRVAPAFIFTWPAALFVVYQTTLNTIVWAEQQPLRAAARWRSRGMVAGFLLTCLMYFHLCLKLGMAMEWFFLMGLLFGFPACALIARQLARPWRLIGHPLWAAVSFSCNYWAAAAFLLWRSGNK